jgi:hypothetical protein
MDLICHCPFCKLRTECAFLLSSGCKHLDNVGSTAPPPTRQQISQYLDHKLLDLQKWESNLIYMLVILPREMYYSRKNALSHLNICASWNISHCISSVCLPFSNSRITSCLVSFLSHVPSLDLYSEQVNICFVSSTSTWMVTLHIFWKPYETQLSEKLKEICYFIIFQVSCYCCSAFCKSKNFSSDP